MTFDTLKYVEVLEKAGVDKKQAAAQAHALQEIVVEKVATKSGLDKVEDSLTARIDKVETALKADIERVETTLTARIDKVEDSLTAKIDKVETTLTAKIDKVETTLTARIDKIDIKLESELKIFKVMGGIILGLLVKLVFFP